MPALEEIEQLPDEPESVAGLGQARHAAEWASRFAPSDRSFVQRFRHNEDIRNYAQRLQDAKAAHIMEQARTNQVAQNFYFRDRTLDLEERKQAQIMQHKSRLFPLQEELAEKQVATLGAREERAAREAIKMQDADKGFNQHMSALLKSGAKRQSPEWLQGIADGLSQFSDADPKTVKLWGAQLFPSEDLTPEEILRRAHQLQASGLGGRVSPSGGISATVPAPKGSSTLSSLEKEQAIKARQLQFLQKEQLDTKDADVRGLLDPQIKEIQDQMNVLGARIEEARGRVVPAAASAPAIAPAERTATNPQTGEKVVFRNGQWQPLTR